MSGGSPPPALQVMHRIICSSQGDGQVPVAHIPCINDVDGSQVQFVDGHNGWGLTALHIAVFQGSVNTGKGCKRIRACAVLERGNWRGWLQ